MASDGMVVTGGGVGNLIQSTPLIIAAAYKHNRPVDVWLAGDAPWMAEIIRGHESVRRVSHILEESMGPVKRYADVYYTFLRKGAVAKRAPAAKYHASWHPIYPRHETECAMSAIRGAGYQGVTPSTFCCADPFPEPLPAGILVGLSTGSKPGEMWKIKRYPPERYSKVCDIILKEFPSVTFVHAGLASDCAIDHPAVVDLREVGTLREQFGLVARCTAFISNDSGLMHASAAQGTKTFGIFGPTNLWKNLPPENTTPVCLPWGTLDCMPCQKASGGHGLGRRRDGSTCQHECMQQLPPEAVADVVISFLQSRNDEIHDSYDGV
jgi:hypothetical protein